VLRLASLQPVADECCSLAAPTRRPALSAALSRWLLVGSLDQLHLVSSLLTACAVASTRWWPRLPTCTMTSTGGGVVHSHLHPTCYQQHLLCRRAGVQARQVRGSAPVAPDGGATPACRHANASAPSSRAGEGSVQCYISRAGCVTRCRRRFSGERISISFSYAWTPGTPRTRR
jgi:hypothetical protein